MSMPLVGVGGTVSVTSGCAHVWIANSGRGGEPEYRRNTQMWFGEKMHVACARCRCRTWLSRAEWEALPLEGSRLTRQLRRLLGRAGRIAEFRRLTIQNAAVTTVGLTNSADSDVQPNSTHVATADVIALTAVRPRSAAST